ncbi:MAG TPA: zf-HC2 domain-containing protein [Terriglobales bacterium]|nr:zf-HC2 domain-containing protein [Terriglobales bacterium]
MTGRCFFLRRRFVPYIEGELSPGAEERLERHLVRCLNCRELLARVKAGHEAGREFGRLGPEGEPRPLGFDELWARKDGARGRPAAFRLLAAPVALPAIALSLLVLVALSAVSRRTSPPRSAERALSRAGAGRSGGFTPLRIAAFEPNTKSPVVTEGLVRGVYFDEKEKTLHIKLVDNEEKPEPFVICEVRSPGRMAIPQQGSRVRVYGIARFDSQPGRGWNEVNPVTNIDIIKR